MVNSKVKILEFFIAISLGIILSVLVAQLVLSVSGFPISMSAFVSFIHTFPIINSIYILPFFCYLLVVNISRKVQNLVLDQKLSVDFIKEMTKENFENLDEIQLSSRFSKLSKELNNLRKILETKKHDEQHYLEEEQKRQILDANRLWVNEGIALIDNLLRNQNESISYYDDIISAIVKYLNANQGYLYILNDSIVSDPFLEIKSVYAYGKKKYLENKKNVSYQEGLVGQVWFEKEYLYYTDIPKDYVKITSGVGEALPTTLVIFPLMMNDHVVGAIELAFFQELRACDLEFLNKISMALGVALFNIKNNEVTKKLLEESQYITAQMREKEEELLQNMAEMQATQEHMTRIQSEMSAHYNMLNNLAVVSRTDLDGNILFVNDMFLEVTGYSRDELLGKNMRIVSSNYHSKEFFTNMFKCIISGEVCRNEIRNKKKDGSYYWLDFIVASILDETGKPKEYIAQGLVIDELKEREASLFSSLKQLEEQKIEIHDYLEKQKELTNIYQSQYDAVDRSCLKMEYDVAGNIRYINRQFAELLEYQEEKIITQNIRDILPEEELEEFEEGWAAVKQGKTFTNTSKRISQEYLFDKYIQGTYSPLYNKDGIIDKIMYLGYDITQIKRLELDAVNMQKQMEELMHITMQMQEDQNHTYNEKIQTLENELAQLKNS